jgi:hypothetical protein
VAHDPVPMIRVELVAHLLSKNLEVNRILPIAELLTRAACRLTYARFGIR